ncbi:EF-hand domain-containing protein [Salinisphaera aquimarina]|uniref:EF-hand domain-containing protein n=1 Tax=Salinisphaera aquimarina TaxID=2094031 RepID=A0ABV7EUP7_9GAMM
MKTRQFAITMVLAGSVFSVPALGQPQDESGLASLDANSDGVISRQEAANAQVKVFHRLDGNSDGVLGADELKASQPQPDADADRRVKRARAKALDQWFSNLDTDAGGTISLAEYQAGMTPYFDRLDTNGDGVIDGRELKSAYGSDRNDSR